MLKKFLDAGADSGAGGSGGGEDKIVVGQKVSMSDLISGGSDFTPSEDSEDAGSESQEVVEDKPTTVADDKGGSSAAPVTEEKDQATDKDIPAKDKPAASDKPVAPPTLDEVLKGKEITDVLKAAGVDQLFIDMIQYHQATGEINGFIDQRTKSWDKVSDLDIMRHELKKEYGDLPEDKFEKVFKAEVLDRFKVEGDFYDDEKELGQIRLAKEAKKIREQLKKEQGEWKVPEVKPSAELQQYQADREKIKKDYEDYSRTINEDATTKKLITDKRLVLGEGKSAYNYEVEPQQLVDAILDTNKLFASCIKEDGSFDLTRAYKIANYAINLEAVEKSMISRGSDVNDEEFVEEFVNPSKKDSPASGKEEETLQKAFEARGVATTMGAILHGR